jgi:hypothetical protein
LTKSNVDHYLLMSTTPQGSTTSNQDEINLTTTTSTTTITVTDQEYIVIEDETDCRRNEAFDLPKTKKFKQSPTIISNGSEPTTMSSNGNGTNPVETMEHTNGGVNYNGVCLVFRLFIPLISRFY